MPYPISRQTRQKQKTLGWVSLSKTQKNTLGGNRGCFSYALIFFNLLSTFILTRGKFKVKKVVLLKHYLGDSEKRKLKNGKNNSQIDDFFRRKNQNLSVYICLYMFNICLGASWALQHQGFSGFMGVKMRRYGCKNASLWV